MANNNNKEPFKNNDKNFRRDVSIAKAKYRKKRFMWFILVNAILLVLVVIRIYFYSLDKKKLENKIEEQHRQIEQLEKDNKANEIVIKKLRDPEFISDLVRKEYSMSYPGEIIFNLPVKEDFMEKAVKSIMEEELNGKKENSEKNKVIDEEKLKEKITKKEEEEKKREEEKNKKEKNKKEKNKKEENNQEE